MIFLLVRLLRAKVTDISLWNESGIFEVCASRSPGLVFVFKEDLLQVRQLVEEIQLAFDTSELMEATPLYIWYCKKAHPAKQVFRICQGDVALPVIIAFHHPQRHTNIKQMYLTHEQINFSGLLSPDNIVQFAVKQLEACSSPLQEETVGYGPVIIYFSQKQLSLDFKNLSCTLELAFKFYHSKNDQLLAQLGGKFPNYYDSRNKNFVKPTEIRKYLKATYPAEYARGLQNYPPPIRYIYDIRDPSRTAPTVDSLTEEQWVSLQYTPRTRVVLVLAGPNPGHFDFSFIRENYGSLFAYYSAGKEVDDYFDVSMPSVAILRPDGNLEQVSEETRLQDLLARVMDSIACPRQQHEDFAQKIKFSPEQKLTAVFVAEENKDYSRAFCLLQQQYGIVFNFKWLDAAKVPLFIEETRVKHLPALLVFRVRTLVHELHGNIDYESAGQLLQGILEQQLGRSTWLPEKGQL